MDSSQGNASSEKKNVLENLDRDELIRKCKGLLVIAQKARKAKDELASEVDTLKEKLTECDTQKQADKECLKTMQIMVNSLTEHKLESINKITDAEKSIKKLNQQLSDCNVNLIKLSELEIENEAKDKQIQRLTNENEEQEMDLRKLDEKLAKMSELSQRQTQELLILEQSIDMWKAMEVAYHELQHENKELQTKFEVGQQTAQNETTILISQHEEIVDALRAEKDENHKLLQETKSQKEILSEELEKLKQSQPNGEEKIDVLKEQLTHENEQLKKKCDEQAYKLDKYKGKFCEFSSKMKEVKQSKKLLSDTVIEYSKSVAKWQVQISHASKLLVKEVDSLNNTKTELERQIQIGETTMRELKATIDELELRLEDAVRNNDNGDVKEKYEILLTEYKTIQQDIEKKNSEINNLTHEWEQICAALKEENENRNSEIEKLSKECRNKCKQITELEEKGLELIKQKTESSDEINRLNDTVNDLRKIIEDLESRLKDTSTADRINKTEEKYENLLTEYKCLHDEMKKQKSEIADFRQKSDQICATLNEQNEKYAIQVEELRKECQIKSKELTELEENRILINQINDELSAQIEALNGKIQELERTINGLESRLEDTSQSDEINVVKEQHDKLQTEYKSLQANIEEKNAKIINLTHQLEEIRAFQIKQYEKQNSEMKKLFEECQSKSLLNSELEEKEAVANKKHAELLAEMRELNDVLKKRGEVISNQSTETDQLKVELNHLKGTFDDQTKQIAWLEDTIKEKTKQVDLLRNQFDNQSETLSTSTISRTDEMARMGDIEDSFEEKYNKLRGLALKLKKKIAQQQTIIAKHESAKTGDVESNNTPSVVPIQTTAPVQVQNLISVQKDNDRLLDKIDAMKSEQKQLKSEINQLNQQIKTAEEVIKSLRIVNEDVKAEADTNLKIKSALDEQIRAGEKIIETLKSENKNVMQQLKNAENELIKIKDLVKQKENEITQKAEEVSKTIAEMNKLKATIKKSSVLNLEVEAYEKSLNDMSQKYESTLKQLSEAKTEIESQQITIRGLNTEIQTLSNQLELEKQNSNEYQQQTELQRIKLKENILEITELKRKIDDHVKEANHIKIELTNLQSQQSENEVEKQRYILKLKTENENNLANNLSLEAEVRDLRTKLNNCEQELANVQTDFASYKIKAQAVLRQNQLKDSSSEEELKEELAILTQTKEELNAKLAHSSEYNRRLENTIEELKGEKTNLQDRCKKLLQLLDETRQQSETIQTESRKQIQEHHEALKMQRLQVDTLNNCYKNQIDEMQKKYEDEIAALKSMATAKVQKHTDNHDTGLSLAKGAQLTTEQRIELLMMERQDGEGSECTSSSKQRKVSNARGKHEVIPLDELLNNTFEEEFESTEQNEERTISTEKFEAQQSRVKHLSTLLSEAEMDVARLTEMNTMLKEELRRQERSTEREKEMKNLEYMKNVIFKFLTINNADERAHLVPVLNIILKLSPDESKTLQFVARGGDGAQSGWSSLLPMW